MRDREDFLDEVLSFSSEGKKFYIPPPGLWVYSVSYTINCIDRK